jgi:hypothetical protein
MNIYENVMAIIFSKKVSIFPFEIFIFTQSVNKVPGSLKIEGELLCSKKPAMRPYSEPVQSSSH